VIVWIGLFGLMVACLVAFAAALTVMAGARRRVPVRAARSWPFDAL
jgi:hypothetical protein